MLKGTYDLFNSSDIFSGRVLLIALQSAIYFIGGINVFTTSIGTIATAVFCCYLIIFKLAKYQDHNSVLLAASLFYFNPVISEITLGVMPDVYVMLAGILIWLLWKKILRTRNSRKIIYNSMLCGLIIFAAMFFKENAIIFIPFLFFVSFIEKRKKNIIGGFTAVVTFLACVFCSGLIYYHYTGDFFFRVHQIQNSSYPNLCNYDGQPLSALLVRLTYGAWQQFIIDGFYPVILAAIVLLLHLLYGKKFKLEEDQTIIYFIILLVLGLYFPFSFNGYQPLCINARHFIFLLPPAIFICVSFLQNARTNKNLLLFFILASVIIFAVSILSGGDQRYTMVCGLLVIYFIISIIFSSPVFYSIKFIFFAAILLFYSLPSFLQSGNWFKNMETISSKTSGTYFYFPDHDNMMHWQLLHGFNDSIHCYDLEKSPFMIFKQYYEILDTKEFHTGWLIINDAYTTRSDNFLHRINVLNQMTYLPKKICEGNVCAYYIDLPERLMTAEQIIHSDDKVFQ